MPDELSIEETVQRLYDQFGQRKTMGSSVPDTRLPLFFLLRPFLSDIDCLILFNTKRCRYQCYFCQLPAKSSRVAISKTDITAQFLYVMEQLRHALSLIDRITLSNEGSVLDEATFPSTALLAIARGIARLRHIRRMVLETRLEFVMPDKIAAINDSAPRCRLDILTGFESSDPAIRDKILGKRESIPQFLSGLDRVAASAADLTAYVLYKPTVMTDAEAFDEAATSIEFLRAECSSRGINLIIRLNPMYAALGSQWTEWARSHGYTPPRLTDVMRLAARVRATGLPVYIGLSTEGLSDTFGTYTSRDDYSPALIRPIKLFNEGKLQSFDGYT